jgi:hypothetical protein
LTGKSVSFGDLYRADVIEMETGKPLQGIFANLKRRFGSDLLGQGVVEISASSAGHMTVSVLLDPDPTEYFGTSDEPNSWIQIDFCAMKLSLTAYSLRTHSHQGNGHIRGWIIEAMDEYGGWRTLDRRTEVDCLDGSGLMGHFRLAEKSPFYRIFRLRQTQKNTLHYNNLRLSQIEFFGALQTNVWYAPPYLSNAVFDL